MFSMQSVSKNPLIATFQLLSAASLNFGRSQNGVLGNGLRCIRAHFCQSMAVQCFCRMVQFSAPVFSAENVDFRQLSYQQKMKSRAPHS